MFFDLGGEPGETGQGVKLAHLVYGIAGCEAGFEGLEDFEDADVEDGLMQGGIGRVGEGKDFKYPLC